jgi:hypothetical protein
MTIFCELTSASSCAAPGRPGDLIVMHGGGGGGGGGGGAHGGHGGHGSDWGGGGWGGDGGGGCGGGGNWSLKIVLVLILAYIVLAGLGVIGR